LRNSISSTPANEIKRIAWKHAQLLFGTAWQVWCNYLSDWPTSPNIVLLFAIILGNRLSSGVEVEIENAESGGQSGMHRPSGTINEYIRTIYIVGKVVRRQTRLILSPSDGGWSKTKKMSYYRG
jgi:hypothetical protein